VDFSLGCRALIAISTANERAEMKFNANTIFMLAPQRHGSNKTQSLLAANHPSLLGPFPPVLGHWFQPLEGPLGDGLVEAMVASANLSPRPSTSADGQAMSSGDVRATMAKESLPATILGITTAIYSTGASLINRGDARILCKSPDNLRFIDEITSDVQDATFLHLVRDPRGVWNSGRGTARGPQSPYASAIAWRDYHGKVLALKNEISLHTVRFEDLLAQPELELQQVCSFLGIPFAPEMLNAHESAESQWAAKSSKQLWGNLDKPIKKGRAEAWRQELPEEEIAIVEAACSDLMAQFAYSTTLPVRTLLPSDIDGKPTVAPQAADADPRQFQLEHLRELYMEHNVQPKSAGK